MGKVIRFHNAFLFKVLGIYDSLSIILCFLDVTMLKTGSSLLKEEEEDDQAGNIHSLPLITSQKPFYDGPMPTPRQKPFQSGSTPLHLTHRFMVSLGCLHLTLKWCLLTFKHFISL